jgi:hypothetical protein
MDNPGGVDMYLTPGEKSAIDQAAAWMEKGD